MSNEELLKWVSEESKDAEQIAIILQDSEGYISTYYSQDDTQAMVGMLEIGKQQIINDND